MLRRLSLVCILGFGAWALWPRGAVHVGDSTQEQRSSNPRKYTIRFAPGIYMPGRRPMDVGKPLQGLEEVARQFEAQFPDTRIEFSEAPVGSREYLVTQLAAGQAPEVLNVNVEDVWQDVQKGWYVALDPYLERPNQFIEQGSPGSVQWWDQFKYQAISRGKAAPDGKMYCLTFDMVETGVFYNKKIFDRLGLSIPKDWNEFIQIQEKLKNAGVIPFLADSGTIADWGMDLIFNQVYGSIIPGIDVSRDPKRDAYMAGYLDWDEVAFLNAKGYFTRRDPRYIETFRILKAWRTYLERNMASNENLKLFVNQKGAMYWGGSWTVNSLTKDPDVDFPWGIFYLPSIPSSYSRFADGHPQVVIGGSGTQFEVTNSAFNDTRDPATSVKLKRTVAFLQFMTVPKNADRVINEILALLPNINGVEPQAPLMPFHVFLQRPYTSTKWLYTFDLRFNEIFRRMLDLYMNDGIGEDGFMEWMEKNVRAASETVVRRKEVDLSKYDAKWQELAPLRAQMKELPSEK